MKTKRQTLKMSVLSLCFVAFSQLLFVIKANAQSHNIIEQYAAKILSKCLLSSDVFRISGSKNSQQFQIRPCLDSILNPEHADYAFKIPYEASVNGMKIDRVKVLRSSGNFSSISRLKPVNGLLFQSTVKTQIPDNFSIMDSECISAHFQYITTYLISGSLNDPTCGVSISTQKRLFVEVRRSTNKCARNLFKVTTEPWDSKPTQVYKKNFKCSEVIWRR